MSVVEVYDQSRAVCLLTCVSSFNEPPSLVLAYVIIILLGTNLCSFWCDILECNSQDNKDVWKFVLGKHNLTSPISSYYRPEVVTKSQSYFFTHSVKAIEVTSTAKGITSKQLLIGTIGDQVGINYTTEFFNLRLTETICFFFSLYQKNLTFWESTGNLFPGSGTW